jgi:branched-chain amino acid aminotransferase
MESIYFVDGEFVPASRAVLPIHDLGILRGYGIFDFMRTYGGRPIFILDHVRRLVRSAAQIGLALPWSQADIVRRVKETLERNALNESGIRILVTGGPSADFITPEGAPRLVIMATALKALPARCYEEGAKIVTTAHARSIPGAKSIDYIRAILSLAEARRENAIEAVYADDRGWITEGTTSNLFAFIGGKLVTPGEGILNGITRQKVLALAEDRFRIDIRRLSRSEVAAAAEVFITSSSRMIVPVAQMDADRIGTGAPGEKTRAIMKAFGEYTAGLAAAFDWQKALSLVEHPIAP